MYAYRACCFHEPSGRIPTQKEGGVMPTVQVPAQLTVDHLMMAIKQLAR